MLPLSSANCCHHPLKFYFLCWFHFCNEALHSEHTISFPKSSEALYVAFCICSLVFCAEGTRLSLTCLLASSSCFVAFCSSKPRASAWPAVSSCSCFTVSISHCLWGERAQTTIRYWRFRAGMPRRWHTLVIEMCIKNHIQLLHVAAPQDPAPGTLFLLSTIPPSRQTRLFYSSSRIRKGMEVFPGFSPAVPAPTSCIP